MPAQNEQPAHVRRQGEDQVYVALQEMVDVGVYGIQRGAYEQQAEAAEDQDVHHPRVAGSARCACATGRRRRS